MISGKECSGRTVVTDAVLPTTTTTTTVFLESLPDDVVYVILSYCDLHSLGRLSRTSRRLANMCRQDCVWLAISKRLTVVQDCRRRSNNSHGPHGHGHRWRGSGRIRELCRQATNWKRSHYRDTRLIYHPVKQLPWLQLDENHLWISYKNLIRCYNQRMDGHLNELTGKTMRHHVADVCRFVSKQGLLLSGSWDGTMYCRSTETGAIMWSVQGHQSDVHAVDFHHNVAVSGSRDATVKVWNMMAEDASAGLRHIINVHDRVWSIAMNPDGRSFVTGTAGINHVPPLRLWDTNTAELLGKLGERYKNGAGVLDIHYETPDILLSCGYDTYIRLWDLRCSHSRCVKFWEDPFDSTLYCIRSDGQYAMVSGTARHGLVRLWDKRKPESIQMYYCGKSSSPVYAMAFDASRLYVALDKGINMLDFSIR